MGTFDANNHAPEDDDATRLHTLQSTSPASVSAMSGDADFPERLTILENIAQGGIGRILLAYDETIGRRVAVKLLLDEFAPDTLANREVLNTFIHEAKITGKLEHPGIVPVYELGKRNDGRPYYVMRYVKGETLEKALKKCVDTDGETAFAQRMKLLDHLIAVCDTVAYAHSRGVIHRDLKPANVISGGFGETVVLDWGLAQAVEENDNTYFYREVMTHQRNTLSDNATSEVLGTPSYMAPEQFQGMAGKASDVYSLGVILYRILTGELPYRGLLADIERQIKDAKSSPSAKLINPSAPPELVAICEKAMCKQAEGRFADAGELAEQLKHFREGRMVNVYAYSRKELLRRFVAQNKPMLVLAGLLMVAVISGGGFSFYYAMLMEQAKMQAEESLVLVTALGEQSQKEARAVARSIATGTDRLFGDLKALAEQINLADSSAVQQQLALLQNKYPKFESFSLRNAAEISPFFGKDAGDTLQQVMRPVAQIDDKRLSLYYRVPIMRNDQITGYIEGRMLPEKALPDFIPLNIQSADHPRHVWIMRNDGLIVFDELPEYIGTNLFIDPSTNRSPSLQAFGHLMLTDDDSIGYYSFEHDAIETRKVAAWDSVNFSADHSWKVIVNYAYMEKTEQGLMPF